jgi:cell division protein FtsW (lipid II flippase)
MFTNPKGWCAPTIIYVALGLITILGILFSDRRTVRQSGMTKGSLLLSNIISLLIMTMVFYLLCSNGYTTTAYVLLLLPIIVGLVLLLIFAVFLGTAIGTADTRGHRGRGRRVRFEPRERVVVRREYN